MRWQGYIGGCIGMQARIYRRLYRDAMARIYRRLYRDPMGNMLTLKLLDSVIVFDYTFLNEVSCIKKNNFQTFSFEKF